MASPTLYFPPFYHEEFRKLEQNEKSIADVHAFFTDEKTNWITEGLLQEIESNAPIADDIIDSRHGTRDPEKFKIACTNLFPVGRKFASKIQFRQACKMFCDSWAISCVLQGKKICCHYSKRPQRTKCIDIDPLRKHARMEFNCPFSINFSLIDLRIHEKQPENFYQIKITRCNLEHTCELSTTFHRQAIEKSGRKHFELETMQYVMWVLRENPSLSTNNLRPLLQKFLPHYKEVSAKFMQNFRRRVAKYWIVREKPEGIAPLTLEEAEQLISVKPIAADENIDIDDHVTSVNLHEIHRKTMQESSDTWETIRYLSHLRETIPGFVYSVKYDIKGRPMAIMYMTPRMRNDLIRFSDLLFLDGQQRQFNSSGYPYISPIVLDEENMVAQCAEAICIVESDAMYSWILLEMQRLEPLFKLKRVKFIFGDLKITDALLTACDIADTCILRGDTWHLLHEVWPKKTNFGNRFSEIQPFLQGMLESKSKADWECCYQQARERITYEAHRVQKLDEIYSKPSYYAGYIIYEMEGTLQRFGDAPAESNHSSVVAYLGLGANWSVIDQVKKLMERQQNRTKKKLAARSELHVKILGYKVKSHGNEQNEEMAARRALSQYSFTNHFLPNIQMSHRLQYVESDGIVTVWRNNHERPDDDINKKSFTIDGRCPCRRRRNFLIQCEHEYRFHREFRPELFADRWFNDNYYCREVYDYQDRKRFERVDVAAHALEGQYFNEGIAPIPFIPSQGIADQGITEGDEEYEVDENQFQNNVFEDDNDTVGDAFSQDMIDRYSAANANIDPFEDISRQKLQFPVVSEAFTELCKMIQNDQQEMTLWMSSVNKAIDAYRNGKRVELNLTTITCGSTMKQSPLQGITACITNATRVKRKKSGQEYSRCKKLRTQRGGGRRGHCGEMSSQVEDNHHLPACKKQTKTCGICKIAGHQKQNCPLVTKFGTPLPLNNLEIRMELSRRLGLPNGFIYSTKEPGTGIYERLPNQNVRVLILHKIAENPQKNDDSLSQSIMRDIIVMCTILTINGKVMAEYDRVWFLLSPVARHISKSGSTMVVNQLVIPAPPPVN